MGLGFPLLLGFPAFLPEGLEPSDGEGEAQPDPPQAEEHPELAAIALQACALASEREVYLKGTDFEGRFLITLALALDDERAKRLFNFLHELTE